jgi:hypothetical protein
MKRITGILAAFALVIAAASPVLAGDEGKAIELAGWITDSYCGKANANAEGKACAIACAKKGAELVLAVDGKIYKLSDQEGAMEHVGHEVIVTGTVQDDTIKVESFAKKEKA